MVPGHEIARNRIGQPDSYAAGRAGIHPQGRLRRLVDGRDDIARMRQETGPFGGQVHTAGDARKQCDTKRFLKLLDRGRDGGLRDIQLLGGQRDLAEIGGGDEISGLSDGDWHADLKTQVSIFQILIKYNFYLQYNGQGAPLGMHSSESAGPSTGGYDVTSGYAQLRYGRGFRSLPHGRRRSPDAADQRGQRGLWVPRIGLQPHENDGSTGPPAWRARGRAPVPSGSSGFWPPRNGDDSRRDGQLRDLSNRRAQGVPGRRWNVPEPYQATWRSLRDGRANGTHRPRNL